MEPIADLTGKISKSSDLVFKHTTFREKIVHRLGKRNLGERPYTAKEVAQHNKFSAISKNVAARMDIMSSTYNQDMAAFMAQRDLPDGIRRFRPWLWADEKKKLQ